MTFGFDYWHAPLQAFALVMSPRLGLQQLRSFVGTSLILLVGTINSTSIMG